MEVVDNLQASDEDMKAAREVIEGAKQYGCAVNTYTIDEKTLEANIAFELTWRKERLKQALSDEYVRGYNDAMRDMEER